MSEGGRPSHSPNKLGKKLYVVFTEPVEAAGDRMAARTQHLEYQYKLEREGIMFAAGPFLDSNDAPNGSGLIIYRAPSLEAATEIAMNDPFHKLGFRKFRIMPWRVSEGTISIKLDYSTGVYKLD
jgi:uncharacterized protein YciI